MTVRAWWHALRDAGKAYSSNQIGDRAAALTYYSVLAVFPGLIVLISLLGVLGDQGTVDGLLRIIGDLGPPSAVDTLRGPLETIVRHSGQATVALALGAALALWSASGYIGGFIRASNTIWAVADERPFWKLRPLQVVITLGLVTVVAGLLFALVVSGPLADAIGAELGVGHTVLDLWSIVKWPLLFVIAVVTIALLYRISPDARHQGFRWLLPGQRPGDHPLAVRFGRLLALRHPLRLVLEHLREPRRGDRVLDLALAIELGDPVRRPVRGRARADGGGRDRRLPGGRTGADRAGRTRSVLPRGGLELEPPRGR